MNIFATYACPQLSAEALCDRRLVKMILETAQLLSTACWTKNVDLGYQPTHISHPCSRWARESSGNFRWLVDHGMCLANEYTHRYGRQHASTDVIYLAAKHANLFPDSPVSFTFNSSGFNTGDVHHDYQLCLVNKWKNLDGRSPAFTLRGKPEFYDRLWHTL